MPDITFHSVTALFFCIVCNMQIACFVAPPTPLRQCQVGSR